MWIPESAEELERLVAEGALPETEVFDAKAALPEVRKNADLAWDVAAMSTDGGVLLYGVGEDADGRPTVLMPFQLKDQRERVDQIVRTSLAEVPYIDVRELPLERDASSGYLLIVVPASARAPHQVIVKGKHQHRFYGRGPTGNRVLSEGDIARLYERRQRSEVDRERILREIVSVAPEQAPSESRAHMHAFARPVFPDQELWRRARRDAGNQDVIAGLTEAAARAAAPGGYDPALHVHGRAWRAQGADAWRAEVTRRQRAMTIAKVEDERRIEVAEEVNLRCDVNIDGRGQLYCSRVAERTRRDSGGNPLLFFEQIAAGNLASFLAVMAELYERASYFGSVDVGVLLLGLDGAIPSSAPYADPTVYNAEAYSRTRRYAAGAMGDSQSVAMDLLGSLFEMLLGESYSPFN
jgi:hypothetical protein